MNIKEFQNLSTQSVQDPPHRAMSRAPANHKFTTILLGCAAAAGVLTILWALYAY